MPCSTLVWQAGGVVIVDDFHLVGVRAAVHEFRARTHAGGAPPLLPVPSDHVTTCAPDWTIGSEGGEALTVHPITVAYWQKPA